jgi:arsenate reductase
MFSYSFTMNNLKKKVLFLCTHNSARSQMAEAFLNHLYGERYEARSAGIIPTKINPYVVKVMAEEGIDLRNARSKDIEEFTEDNFNLVITLCDDAKENCPVFSGDARAPIAYLITQTKGLFNLLSDFEIYFESLL